MRFGFLLAIAAPWRLAVAVAHGGEPEDAEDDGKDSG